MASLLFALLGQVGPFDEKVFEFDYADHVSAEDLNADGRSDLIIQSGVDLLIYFQTAAGALPDKPDRSIRLTEDAFVWTSARFDGSLRILAMGARGIQFVGDKEEDAVVGPTIFEGRCSAAHPPVRFDFAKDVDGDGVPELLMFVEGGAALFSREGSRFRVRHRFGLGIEAAAAPGWGARQFGKVRVSIPVLLWRDVDGNGRLDLVSLLPTEARFHLQGADGAFAAPVASNFAFKARQRPRPVQFEVPPRLADLTGDGVLDVTVTDASRGRARLYYGRADKLEFTAPDEEREISNSWSVGTMVEDLDADGRPELVMWTLPKLGLFGALSAFSSKKVAVEMHFFKAAADGRVSKQAAQSIAFDMPFVVFVSRDRMSFDFVFEPHLAGDLNGDGAKDVVLLVGQELAVYLGRKDGSLVENQPAATLKVRRAHPEVRTRLETPDLNGDGKADLLLRHLDPETGKTVVQILTSRR